MLLEKKKSARDDNTKIFIVFMYCKFYIQNFCKKIIMLLEKISKR